MKVTTERNENCSAVVTIQVDDEQLQAAMKSAAARISKIRPIPGFRPGKAPFDQVVRAFGKEVVRDEAIEDLAQSLYKQALKEQGVEPYDAGKLDIVQKEPVILKYTIPTRPVVTLGDYRSIRMHPEPVSVSDEEFDQVIERWRMEQATTAPVTRAAQMGDMLTVNVKGGIEGQTPIDQENMQVRIEEKEPTFPWVDQLIGANAGETRTVNYTYPADAVEQVAGKTATYTVLVNEVKETQLPELNDEFAKSVSAFETFEALKTRLRASLQEQKQTEEDDRFADQVVDAVVEQSKINYPELMLEDEMKSEIARSRDLAQRLGLKWDKYLELAGKDENTFADDIRPRADRRIRRLLTILNVIDAEKIEVAPKEVDMEIDARAQAAARQGGRADQMRRQLSTAESRHDIEYGLKVRKAIDFLVASAKGEPTSGKILTPDMVIAEQRAREQAERAAQAAASAPTGLITDPSQVRGSSTPSQLGKIILPGQE